MGTGTATTSTAREGQPHGDSHKAGDRDSHAVTHCDDRKAAPVGLDLVGARASGRGGVRQALWIAEARRRTLSSYGSRCAASRRSPCCCRTPNPRLAPGLARLRVQRTTREARPRSRPNRPLSHCRPKRRRDSESGTNRREHCRADSDGGDFGSEKVHSVPPVARPAERHAMRRPSGVTAPRCRRLVRSTRRRRRTR